MNGFENIFGKLAPGMCRLSMQGDIAVKTSGGYKSFDPETKRLTNCDSFVFNIGEEFFFLIPTNRVRCGDIILAGGKPRCVLSTQEKTITVMNYEDATIETLLPEHHVFLGDTYFYGKVVSLFGKKTGKGKKGTGTILKYMMLSELMKGSGSQSTGHGPFPQAGGIGALLPLLFLNQKEDSLFGDLFGDEDPEEDAADDSDK